MKIAMTMVVRNEADVIEYNIRYHASRGIQGFIVMDHMSTDGTKDILEALSKEFDLQVIHQKDERFCQGPWMSDLGAKAFNNGADWVVNNDADEFWNLDIDFVFSYITPEIDCIQCPWRVVYSVPGTEPFFMNTHVRDEGLCKTIMKRHDLISVSIGNHWVHSAKEPRTLDWVKVYHYSNRNPGNLFRRYVQGGEAIEKTPYPEWFNAHWREGLKAYREGKFEEFVNTLLFTEDTVKTVPGIFTDTTMKDYLSKIEIKYGKI